MNGPRERVRMSWWCVVASGMWPMSSEGGSIDLRVTGGNVRRPSLALTRIRSIRSTARIARLRASFASGLHERGARRQFACRRVPNTGTRPNHLLSNERPYPCRAGHSFGSCPSTTRRWLLAKFRGVGIHAKSSRRQTPRLGRAQTPNLRVGAYLEGANQRGI